MESSKLEKNFKSQSETVKKKGQITKSSFLSEIKKELENIFGIFINT